MPSSPETPNTRARSLDPSKFENVLQVGGIRTGRLDAPGAGGGEGTRVALVDTGAGFRFTVALDRGGDIIDATYQDVALAYLTPNGLGPPSHAYHLQNEWLRNWPGGLVTTCGPEFIGGARLEEGVQTSLHGRYSNTPAVVERIVQPNPRRGRDDLELALIVRDTRVFGPIFEIRRTIRCRLGEPALQIEDEVVNQGDTPATHHWLYHCNFGYPLLDQGGRFVYSGQAEYWQAPPPPGLDIIQPLEERAMNALKQVPAALAEHVGGGERGLVVAARAQADGMARIGVLNDSLGIGVELTYPVDALPRMAHWQHYSPGGSYVSALEPFYGSLMGQARDRHPLARSQLQPGESRKYRLEIRVRRGAAELADLAACDGPLTPIPA